MQDIAEVCGMLSDATRLGIVALLTKSGKSVGTLCDKLGLPQPTVSHHLGLLRHTGLVTAERDGKKRIYSLKREQLTPLKKFLAKVR